MGNWNSIKLTCSDLQKFTEIMKSSSFKNFNTEFEDGAVILTGRDTLPVEKISELSKQNTDLTFTIEFCVANKQNTLYRLTYKNGEEIDKEMLPRYTLMSQAVEKMEDEKRMMAENWDNLFDKAIQIFGRIDIVKQDEKGNKYIDFVGGITLIVENERYQMQLSKNHSDIKIECFEKEEVITVKLVPVGTSSPFK